MAAFTSALVGFLGRELSAALGLASGFFSSFLPLPPRRESSSEVLLPPPAAAGFSSLALALGLEEEDDATLVSSLGLEEEPLDLGLEELAALGLEEELELLAAVLASAAFWAASSASFWAASSLALGLVYLRLERRDLLLVLGGGVGGVLLGGGHLGEERLGLLLGLLGLLGRPGAPSPRLRPSSSPSRPLSAAMASSFPSSFCPLSRVAK